MGMVGGGLDAMAGAIHRRAAERHAEIELVAGALASTPECATAAGRESGLSPARTRQSWQQTGWRSLRR
jgi:hypothetical protein